jgi:selenide, water dikinase
MKTSAIPSVKNLVLLGGGHSHVTVLKRLGMKPLPGLSLTLVARDVHTPYSGMLPGYIAGHYGYDDCHIDLARLAHFADATLIHAEAEGLDPEQRLIRLPGRPPLRYDLLSINTGSRPPVLDVPGAAEHALPVKPIDRFLERWERLIARFMAHQGRFRLLVAGAGAGGVELLLAARHRLRHEAHKHGQDPDRLDCRLVSATPQILPGHNDRVRAIFDRVLAERGVTVERGRAVTRVAVDDVELDDGRVLPADIVLWVTGASASPWLRESGLDTGDTGFVRVDAMLRSLSHPEVFAAGDVAEVVDHPRPKSGVFAVRQGPPLEANLRRAAQGQQPRRFRPQHQFLSLISTGDACAVASRGRWALEGAWLWRWKDHIDRTFMDRFNRLPEMTTPAPELAAGLADAATLAELRAHPMRCGGCGAKLGSDLLERVLARLDLPARDDIPVGVPGAEDAAVLRLPADRLLVQSVDYFRSFIDDPWLFGRIAANHALGDLFAMGAAPHSALAIATLPHASEALREEQLFQLMSGALSMLNEHGAALIGGHSGEGMESAFGLVVNGLAEPGGLLTKSTLRPNEALILTKPLGTGTLLAAAMRGKARGRWLEAAYDHMQQSSAAAADILRSHGARACTDVTGFGLLGHLLEMLRASGVSARIDLAALPALDGALELLGRGVASSLAPDNLRLRRGIVGTDHSRHPHYPLLFDPQTAGGLLAGVPDEQAGDCLAALHAEGYRAARVIGRVGAAGPAEVGLSVG